MKAHKKMMARKTRKRQRHKGTQTLKARKAREHVNHVDTWAREACKATKAREACNLAYSNWISSTKNLVNELSYLLPNELGFGS